MDHIQSIGFYFSFIPLEVRGFVIAAVIVMQGIALFQVMKRIRRPGRFKAAKKARPVSARAQAKAREAALAAGFMVEDIERDMPDMDAGGMLRRGPCAHYYFPERIWAKASWALLRRPGDMTQGFAPGWTFRQLDGSTTPESFSAIAAITDDDDLPRGFFEIESRDSFLHFYWDEAGGKAGVARIKDYIDKLKNLS